MKKLIIGALILIAVFVVVLNTGIVAGQALDWVKENPKDPDAPLVLYRTARWCDIMGSDQRAESIYLQLYQQYPEKAELCAPALYYVALDISNSSYATGVRKQALPYLQTIIDKYSDQEEWRTKAKQLYDEVNYAH
ncbi:MAG TPA: hypothetical protein VHE12_14400 [bacterium]|nr:hypothetical protein [bacterium]